MAVTVRIVLGWTADQARLLESDPALFALVWTALLVVALVLRR